MKFPFQISELNEAIKMQHQNNECINKKYDDKVDQTNTLEKRLQEKIKEIEHLKNKLKLENDKHENNVVSYKGIIKQVC